MVEFIKGVLYTCECGYKTIIYNLAHSHSKTKKCLHREMKKEEMRFVTEKDYVSSMSNQPSNSGVYLNDCPNSNVSQTNISIHLTVPDKSVVQSIYDAVKNPDCVAEIRGADPQQIPAILFKYTRGTKAEQQMIQYDADKNVVKCVDPVTKKEVSKDLKKYRNEYLVENADIYDKDYHIPYMPPKIQPVMRELADPQYDTGKKKEEPIPGADVIKMCAAGDHRMYKLPHDSKKFYTQVANNVDKEIKSTT